VSALLTAHQKGVIHFDIKPENIMLTPAGQVKVLDFGIAKRLLFEDAGATTSCVQPEGLVGTLNYMAPEVLAGAIPDARSDIYSLGVTLYEVCGGRRPGSPASRTLLPQGNRFQIARRPRRRLISSSRRCSTRTQRNAIPTRQNCCGTCDQCRKPNRGK